MKYRGMIVGEAWGEEEARLGMAFVGAGGKFLNEMLDEADLSRKDFYTTNVFNFRPPSGDIRKIMVGKDSLPHAPFVSYGKGLYLPYDLYHELQRLWAEIREIKPNLIIALGATATWALTGTAGIRAVRGTVLRSQYPAGFKVIPAYHPSAILRDFSLRPSFVADLQKAKQQLNFPEIRRASRSIWLAPTLNHIKLFFDNYVKKAKYLAFDIETAGNQITCVGFAVSPKLAIVIPFVDFNKPDLSYWPEHEEVKAWELVRQYLHCDAEKIGQNTLYDINWLWHKVGMYPKNYTHDTMLQHHALQPEMEKSLGFLASIYTDEPAWKTMRGKGLFTMKKGE